MKKILPIATILILALIAIVPYSYSRTANSNFFTVSKSKVNPGETIEMTIDLNKVDYTSFKFTLISDFNVDKIYTNEEAVQIEKENDNIKMNIDKQELGLDKITLYYDIPEEIQDETTFVIIATATNTANEEETLTSMLSISVTNKSSNDKNNDNKNTSFNADEKQNEFNSNLNGQSDRAMAEKADGENASSISKTGSGSTSSKGTMSGNQETVTYNGSDNNYLSSLSVDGYLLNKEFNKESSTYFVKVGSEATSLNVECEAEDDNAVICVSGADNLKSGTNKILISVTSESGQVRTYRIYVTQS